MKMKNAVMLSALSVPYEMAMESELGSRIFYHQAQLAAERIAADALRIAELESALSSALSAAEKSAAAEMISAAHDISLSGTPHGNPATDPARPERHAQELSDQQILEIARTGRLLIRNSQIALRFARAVLEAARLERLSDEKIVKIAHATRTPIHTGKGALRFSRILLAGLNQINAASLQ